MRKFTAVVLVCAAAAMVAIGAPAREGEPTVRIPDTMQSNCYGTSGKISAPRPGHAFYGQDAQYAGARTAYRDNGDGTVTDLVTGLMWSKGCDAEKVSLIEAKKIAANMTLAGHNDWRVPTIKELYSLMDFRGFTGFNGRNMSSVPANAIPYINTDYFDFRFGDTNAGERYIDAQWLTSTEYTSTTMNGAKTLFGVNFADGRIKGYGYSHTGRRPGGRGEKKFYARYVRGGNGYGENRFVDNADGTVTDQSTGMMWQKADSGKGMKWTDALAYAETLTLAGHDDWRLPNAKELQYIVDYSRSPDATRSAAIDPIFEITAIKNEAGEKDYPCFWSSTTHLDGPRPGMNACYVAFGRALGKMHGRVIDVHGAGAQRSDPKSSAREQFRGPQGDAVRVTNYVRCVRAGATAGTVAASTDRNKYPNVVNVLESETKTTNARSSNEGVRGGSQQRGGASGNGGHRPSPMDGTMSENGGSLGSSIGDEMAQAESVLQPLVDIAMLGNGDSGQSQPTGNIPPNSDGFSPRHGPGMSGDMGHRPPPHHGHMGGDMKQGGPQGHQPPPMMMPTW